MLNMLYFQIAYISLGILGLTAVLIAYFRFGSVILKKALGKLFLSTLLLDAGIIVHTFAVMKFGSDNAQFLEVVAGHVLIAIGLVMLMLSIKNVETISEQIGFGG